MTATIQKNLIPILFANFRADVGFYFLTIDCPKGWDDVKKISHKVLAYEGRNYVFSGWCSDKNVAFFRAGTEFAAIV